MTFGEKLINARLSLNLSQLELASKVGITERSIYSYEQTGTLPRTAVLKRLAEALDVTIAYLVDEAETDKMKNIDEESFLDNAKKSYGNKGLQEAEEILQKTKALFAGGELDDEAMDMFRQSLMEVFLESKAESEREVYTKAPKKPQSVKIT